MNNTLTIDIYTLESVTQLIEDLTKVVSNLKFEIKDFGSEFDISLSQIAETGLDAFTTWKKYGLDSSEALKGSFTAVGVQLDELREKMPTVDKIGLGIEGSVQLFSAFSSTISDVIDGNKTLSEGMIALIPVCVSVGAAMFAAFGPPGLIIAGVAAAAGALAATFSALSKSSLPEIQAFSESVSEETLKTIEPLIDLADAASEKIIELFMTAEPLTAENTAKIGGHFKEMTDSVISDLEKMRQSSLDSLADIFSESAALCEADLATLDEYYSAKAASGELSNEEIKAQRAADLEDLIEKQNQKIEADKTLDTEAQGLKKQELEAYIRQREAINENYDTQIEDTQKKHNEMTEILRNKITAGEALTKDDFKNLGVQQDEFLTGAVTNLSENAKEQELILETLKTNSTTLAAQQASEMLQTSAKSRDDEIRLAGDKCRDIYNAEVEKGENLRFENGGYTNDVIENARKERDAIVAEAEKKHKDVVDKIKISRPEILENIDETSGKVRSKWSQFWSSISSKFFGKTTVNVDAGVSTAASGGFFSTGQMFIAREAGPEMVGTIGSRSAVVNNSQIVESVSRGVYDAVRAAMSGNGSGSTSPLEVNLYLDGKQITAAVERVQKERGLSLMSGSRAYGF